MLRKIGLFSARALANASSDHECQSTGLNWCWRRYGDFSRARRFGIVCLTGVVDTMLSFFPRLALVVMNTNTMTFVAPNLACGKARGASALALNIPHSGSVTDEQRSHRPNSAQPSGRQFFFGQTSLLAPHRSTSGCAAPCGSTSRLVWPKNPLPRMYR